MSNIAKFVCVLTIAIIVAIVMTSRPDNGAGMLQAPFSGIKESPAADAWNFFAGLFNSSRQALGQDRYDGQTDANDQKVYRWQDAGGEWHYTDRPPPGVNAEAMTLAEPTRMSVGSTAAAEK